MGVEARIRIDANGGWNVDEAEHAIHALAEFDLEYAEQPCASVEELAELRRRVKYMGIPIAADESVRKAADPLAVARAGAADIIVVKAQPLGGARRALAIIAEAGLPAVVSSALDTSVGLSMGAALAAALPDLDYDCGLGTASLFTADVAGRAAAAARRAHPRGTGDPGCRVPGRGSRHRRTARLVAGEAGALSRAAGEPGLRVGEYEETDEDERMEATDTTVAELMAELADAGRPEDPRDQRPARGRPRGEPRQAARASPSG